MEDLYLAEKRLAKVRNGKSKTYTLNAVEQALGLANKWNEQIHSSVKPPMTGNSAS
jgi:hypothetical protein